MIIIAGPCQLESKEHALTIANKMKKICDDNGFDYIFKSSFRILENACSKGTHSIDLRTSFTLCIAKGAEVAICFAQRFV